MTRLAQDRDTHLTPTEIAAEALRQFDEGKTEPSIRSLASELQVTPYAIYHHYPSRAEIVQAAVALVWQEAVTETLELEPKPFEADPLEVLLAGALATRRVWYRHYRVAPYMAATPEANDFVTNSLGLFANLFERLGLKGEEAGLAFHAYSSFMIGAVLFTALRRQANEQLGETEAGGFRTEHSPGAARQSSEETRTALDEVMEAAAADPERDEELYVEGLRRLIESFR
jgi:AcrR family transcriptional regulator